MNCIYYCTNVYIGNESNPYMERMDEQDDVVPFFADETVYITLLDDDHYAVTNDQCEVFAIGNTGVIGIDEFLASVKYNAVIVNGEKYSNYLARKKRESEDIEGM